MLEKSKNDLLDSGVAVDSQISPCLSEDVDSLKKSLGVTKFPEAYEKFLLKIGRGAGSFMQGTDIFYPGIKELNKHAVALLEENGESFVLPEDSIVFSMHQGYEFLYFRLSDGDDPGVYQYVEGSGEPKKVWCSFTEFVEDMLKQHVKDSSPKER